MWDNLCCQHQTYFLLGIKQQGYLIIANFWGVVYNILFIVAFHARLSNIIVMPMPFIMRKVSLPRGQPSLSCYLTQAVCAKNLTFPIVLL